ncbi:MAG: hypothetical protein WKG03_03815 [Telluria sp.]
MSFKVIAVALTLIGAHAGSMGQTLEKNGLPCVAELCIGDGIAELSKIQWVPAHSSYKVNNKTQLISDKKLSDDDLRVLKSTYPMAGDAAPFLHERTFDASALPMLARVATACQSNELTGTYGANGDTPTRVGISLTPSLADPARQAWTVTTITREFPSAVTNEDRAAISKLLTRSYGKFGAGTRTVPDRPGEGRFFPSGMAKFGFGLSLFRGTDESTKLMTHPACSNGDKAKSS